MVGPMKYHFKNTTMKLSLLTKAIFTIVFLFLTKNNIFAQTKYQKDFYEFWSDINKHYAYLERQNIDWNKVKEIYSSQVEKVTNDNEFIQLLENT
jgi:Tricorn protease C1 domain